MTTMLYLHISLTNYLFQRVFSENRAKINTDLQEFQSKCPPPQIHALHRLDILGSTPVTHNVSSLELFVYLFIITLKEPYDEA